jgi:hypothetical protein
MSIYLTGYMTRGDFRRRAVDLPPGSRILQYRQTRTHSQAVPVADLNPLLDLFKRVQKWASQRDEN